MKVGDLVYDRLEKSYGIIIEEEWETSIGTPFDWLVMWFKDGSFWGADSRYLILIQSVS